MKMRVTLAIGCLLLAASAAMGAFNPFAAYVIDTSPNAPEFPMYRPAPGQFVNNTAFNDPASALGAPDDKTVDPNTHGVVTLGGFGGQILLAFDHDVEDNFANPMGLDAIVYGNATWTWNNPQLHWAEPGTIEIMPELNGNAIAGDAPGEQWYLIPGSHFTEPNSLTTKNWSRADIGYPLFFGWPDAYQTSGYELTPDYQTLLSIQGILKNPNLDDADPDNNDREGYWGYADYNPTAKLGDRNSDNISSGIGDDPNMTPEIFFTTPDDPLTVGLSPASGGGDAFDIQWAVDPLTFQPAELRSFRYIRITSAVNINVGRLKEVSTEIDAVADVRPIGDINGDNRVDIEDLGLLAHAWLSVWGQPHFNPAADWTLDNKIDLKDFALQAWGHRQYYSSF